MKGKTSLIALGLFSLLIMAASGYWIIKGLFDA